MDDDLSTNNIGIKYLEKISQENFCYVIFYECYPIRSSIAQNKCQEFHTWMLKKINPNEAKT